MLGSAIDFMKPMDKQFHARLAHWAPYISEWNVDKHVLKVPLTKSFLLDPIFINPGYITS